MTYQFEQHRITGGIAADDEYWRALEDGAFRLPRCKGCNRGQWPAHFRCGHCGSWELDWVEIAPVGTVYSWTRSHYAFVRVRERAADVPYVTILAEVDASDGARVLGMLGGDDSRLITGAPVRGVILPPSDKTKGYPSICWHLVGSDTHS